MNIQFEMTIAKFKYQLSIKIPNDMNQSLEDKIKFNSLMHTTKSYWFNK